MAVYYILVLVPLLFSFLYVLNKKEVLKRLSVSSFFVIFLLILVFRDETIGCDLINYHRDFDFLASYRGFDINAFSETELGFVWFTKLISSMTDDFHIYIGIIAVISVIPYLLLYVNKSENTLLSLSLFLSIGVFAIFFSGMRQILAMSFVPVAYYCVIHKKKFYFVLTVVCATLFHLSAIVLVLMYPIYYMRLTKGWLIPILVVLIVVFLFRDRIWVQALSRVGGRYEEMYGDLDNSGAIMMFLMTLLFLFYAYIVPEDKSLNGEIVGLRNFLVLSVFIEAFSGVSNIVMRMNHYYSVFIPILIPMISNRCATKNRLIVDISVLVMIVFFIFWFFYSAYNGEDIVQIFPYKSFLSISQ